MVLNFAGGLLKVLIVIYAQMTAVGYCGHSCTLKSVRLKKERINMKKKNVISLQ